MLGITFIEQLKSSWRQILYWGGGLGLLVLFIMGILQDVAIVTQYSRLLERFPQAILSGVGLEDASAISTPEGFVGFAGLTYGMFALAFFAVTAGLDVTANDEDEGILNVLLALPIPRWQVIVERALAYAVIIAAIAMVEFAAMFIGTFITPIEIDLGMLFLGCVNLIPAAWILMAVTIFVSSIFSNKIIVTGISAAFVLGSYVLNTVGSAVTEDSFGRVLGRISVWTYFGVQTVIQDGLNYVNISGLLVLTIVLLVASTYIFERRDIA